MDQKSSNHNESEDNIQKAIESLKNKRFTSIRSAAIHFKIPKSTLTNRMAGRQSRSQSHESFQKLSNAEEKTLVRWISRLTATGYPATPGLLKEMAQEILNQRVIFASSSTPPSFQSNHIGQRWIYRFLDRYPKLKGTYSRKLESARHKEATFETISAWYSTFRARIEERHYELKNIYNMDEIGYAVGETESTRIIVDSTLKSNWKVTAGKQEWITVLECVNADGGSLPPVIIFKAQNTNTAWIPTNTPPNCFFKKIRGKGLTCQNIKSGWKGAGLNPFSPRQVLNNLPTPLLPPPSTPNTPANPEDLDLSLLNSSPPNDIELRQANKVFNSALSANNLPTSPVQRYAKRITHQIESLNAENAILRKELQEYKELLETRKKRKKWKENKIKRIMALYAEPSSPLRPPSAPNIAFTSPQEPESPQNLHPPAAKKPRGIKMDIQLPPRLDLGSSQLNNNSVASTIGGHIAAIERDAKQKRDMVLAFAHSVDSFVASYTTAKERKLASELSQKVVTFLSASIYAETDSAAPAPAHPSNVECGRTTLPDSPPVQSYELC
ncbi:hypothetical protein DID88_001380 [Monilinia fructigena]|uniref:HTH CENPB-type domain-containing protein n=1 Tax=Monilinia fructigena TaxID=38457 RepID=A0A395IZC7_9HELO|nr:hypothetical protein DID88_001380 [Monilinia fructigena]